MTFNSAGFEADNRGITVVVKDNVGKAISVDRVASVSITETVIGDNGITMGTANASKCEISLIEVSRTAFANPSTFIYSTENIYKGAKIEVYFYTSGTVHGRRRFVVDEISYVKRNTPLEMNHESKDAYDVRIIAYDLLSLTDKLYIHSVGTNPTISQVAISALSQCGISDTSGWSTSITINEIPENITCRALLGYLAGLQGCFVTTDYVNNTYQVIPKWYQNLDYTIKYNHIYESGWETKDSMNETERIVILESGTQDDILVASEQGAVGNALSFENPFMTQAGLNSIYSSKIYSGGSYLINYTPATLKWKGNPTIAIGTKLKVGLNSNNTVTADFYVMERELSFDGGLQETYKCVSNQNKSVSFNANLTMQKLERKLSTMEMAIAEATGIIKNAEGSVFELIPRTGGDGNSGWKLYSQVTDNVILANSNGIGFSSNGGQSFNAAAIYIDNNGIGHLNANVIQVDNLEAGRIHFNSSATYTGLNDYMNEQIGGGIVIGQGDITGLTSDLAVLTNNVSTAQTTANSANSKANNALSTANSASATATSADGKVTVIQEGLARYLTCSTGKSVTVKTCKLADNTTFNVTQGTTITVKFTQEAYYPSVSSQLYLSIVYNNGSSCFTNRNILYNGSFLTANSNSVWSLNGTVSFIYDGASWVMQDNVANTILSDWCMTNNRTYIDGSNIYTGTVQAGAIYTGVIGKRTAGTGTLTGNTRFDLDNDYIITGSITGYQSKLWNGGYELLHKGNNAGDMTLFGDGTKTLFGLSYNPNYCNGIGIYQNTDEIVRISKNGGLVVRFNGFSGIINQNAYGNECKLGIGSFTDIDGNSTTGLGVEYRKSGTGNTTLARLDISGSTGYGKGSLRCWHHRNGTPNYSQWLSFGASNLYWGTEKVQTVSTSDRRLKKEIQPIPDNYEAVFDDLQPVIFKYKGKTRTHIGLIAQDVESAITEQGITSQDFAPLCIDYFTEDGKETIKENGSKTIYSLRYEEFIGLCIDKIQKLDNKIKNLEARLNG